MARSGTRRRKERVEALWRRARGPDPAGWVDDRFRLLVDSVSDYAIFMLDPEGRIATWNPGAQRLKGYTAQEILGRHFSVFYLPEVVASGHCERELEEAARTGRFEDEGWRVRKDGSRFWASVVLTAMRDSRGRLRGFAKVTRDLTERKSAQKRIQEGEQRFRVLVEGVRDYAILLLDPSGRVETWNAGAERIKGYRASEIVGKHFSVFYPDEDVKAGKCERELAQAMRDGRLEDEGWRVRKDGSRFWADVVITALHDGETGALIGFAKVTKDLTDRRRAEEERVRLAEAQAAIRLRDGFLARASHELRTPVAALQLQIQSLQRWHDALDQPVAKLVTRVSETTARLASLVEVLLDVSRTSTGCFEIHRERVDLTELARATVERLRPGAAHVGSRIDLDAAAELVGQWDRLRLEQVATNLVGNAVKFGAGSPVAVQAFRRGDRAVLVVSDAGPGIPAELLPRIFGRFEQGAGATDLGGLGLGLFTVREIVEAHGGRIRAENDPNGGARFTVELPLAPQSPDASAEAGSAVPDG